MVDVNYDLESGSENFELKSERSKALDAISGLVIAAEVTFANEAMRFGVFGAAQAAYGNPIISAGAYGAATFAIEGAAGFASARALDSNVAKKSLDKANNLLEKVGISKDAKTSSITKGAAALVGGTAISMLLIDRENPNRTEAENRRYGARSAVGLSGFCAVQGYFMAKGIEVPEPEHIGAGIFALVGARFGASKLIRKMQAKNNLVKDEE